MSFKSYKGPSNSPWGEVQHRQEEAPGIVFLETAGHGGYWVSKQRFDAMPEHLRCNSRGKALRFFEEDCEVALVALAFPEELSDKVDVEVATKTVREWFPDVYEKHFGRKLTPGESHARDKETFQKENADKWVVISAVGGWHEDCPKGMVLVWATKGGRRGFTLPEEWEMPTERKFLVPDAEYDARGQFGFVVDLEKHEEIKT